MYLNCKPMFVKGMQLMDFDFELDLFTMYFAGALDPYKHKMNTGQIDTESFQLAPLIPINDSTSEMEQSYEMSPSEMLVNVSNLISNVFIHLVAILMIFLSYVDGYRWYT